jgi:hypothetical protein
MCQPGCEFERLGALGFGASLRQQIGADIAGTTFQ